MATDKRIAMRQAQVQQELLDGMARLEAKLDELLKVNESIPAPAEPKPKGKGNA